MAFKFGPVLLLLFSLQYIPSISAQTTATSAPQYGRRNALIQDGSDAGERIIKARANLPATGGIIEASFEGAQTIASDILGGTKPTKLELGCGTYTISVSQTLTSGISIWGGGGGNTNPCTTLAFTGTGYLFDRNSNAAPGVDNFELHNLRITISAASSGAIRVGDRTAEWSAAGISEGWLVDNVEIYGSARGTGLDITQSANSKWSRILVNNFASCVQLTSIHQMQWDNLVCNTATAHGLLIENSQRGAIGASMDGTVFNSLILEGIGSGYALEIDRADNATFQGVFLETYRVVGTPVPIRLQDTHGLSFRSVLVSNPGWGEMLQATDAFNIDFDHFHHIDLNLRLTASVSYSARYDTINERRNLGNITCKNCSYQMNRALKGKEGVVTLGSDLFPGSLSAGGQPITGVTDVWSRSLINRQGIANTADTNFVLDGFHGQNHYNSDRASAVVTDATASKGKAVQMTNGTFYGFEFAYPSEINLGTYELVVRGKVSAGTAAPTCWVDSVGSGNVFSSAWAEWSTTYEVSSCRFTLTSSNVGAGSAIRVLVIANPGAGRTYSIDYMALRPAANDFYCQVYSAPASQVRDVTGGAVNGGRVSCATSIPTTGQYEKGDVVYNLNPAGDHTTLPATSGVVNTLGWSRQTSGSNHVAGTDWSPITLPTNTVVGVASLDFAAWAGQDCQDLTLTVTGVTNVDGFPNVVALGLPGSLAGLAGVQFTGFVSGRNAVTVRGCKVTPGSSGDPASAAVTAEVKLY